MTIRSTMCRVSSAFAGSFMLASTALIPAHSQTPSQPNIVVIMGDDIGMWNIGAYSRGLMGFTTPNIDRIANEGGPGGIDRLGAAMLVAAVIATPWGLGGALPAFGHPVLLLAGAGVGVCSSVIPYVTDQLAMARLARATFSLMLALLPVFATVIGAIVLRQVPTVQDVAGVTLVVLGVALHREQAQRKE